MFSKFFKSIEVIFACIVFSCQLFGMKATDISRSAESEYPNAELQESKNELQQKDAIIDSLYTELSKTKDQLSEAEDAYMEFILVTLNYIRILFSESEEATKTAIANQIRDILRRHNAIQTLWPRILQANENEEFRKELDITEGRLVLPEEITEEALRTFSPEVFLEEEWQEKERVIEISSSLPTNYKEQLKQTKAQLFETEEAYIVQFLQDIDLQCSAETNRGVADREHVVGILRETLKASSAPVIKKLWPEMRKLMSPDNKVALMNIGISEVTPLPEALTDKAFVRYIEEGEKKEE